MSSGLLKSARSEEGDAPSRSGHWPLPTELSDESGLPEGSGLLWHFQNELPSRRWYIDAVREAVD